MGNELSPYEPKGITPEIKRDLITLADRRMLSPAREAGYDLHLVGATVLPQQQTIARTQWGTWLFVNHADDPTAEQYKGKIPVPQEQLIRLSALYESGVNPQHVWIAHQLPTNHQGGDPLPDLVPPPKQLREKDKRLKLQLAKATRLFLQGAGMTLGAAMAPAALLVGLDPIILGGINHPDLPIVEWCVLAQWDWE